jgi:hypothetical protein
MAKKRPSADDPSSVYDRSLSAVLEKHEIREWDLVMVGDGSGGSWNIGCGWAVVVVDRVSNLRKLLFAAFNSGTIGIGELMPYWHGLMWFESLIGGKRRHAKGGLLQAHVISDNETVVRQGNGEIERKTNAALWASIECMCRRGYFIKWHWAGRDTTALNSYVDDVSREVRMLVQDFRPTILTEDSTVYHANPS